MSATIVYSTGWAGTWTPATVRAAKAAKKTRRTSPYNRKPSGAGFTNSPGGGPAYSPAAATPLATVDTSPEAQAAAIAADLASHRAEMSLARHCREHKAQAGSH